MADEPHKTPQKITPEDIAMIDEALILTKGNRALAAKMLGLDSKRVQNIVRNVPGLAAKWMDRPVPDGGLASDIHRPMPIAVKIPDVLPAEEAVVDALTQQDELLQKGWRRLGFTAKERNFLSGLQASYTGNLSGLQALTTGGLSHSASRMILILEQIYEKMKEVEAEPEKFEITYSTEFGVRIQRTADQVFMDLVDRAVKVSETIRKMGDSVEKAVEIRLKVEKLQRERTEKVVKKAAGWSTPEKK
jgi:hypothetical protein